MYSPGVMLGGTSASLPAGDRRGQWAAVPSDCTSLWQQKSSAEGGHCECDWNLRGRICKKQEKI